MIAKLYYNKELIGEVLTSQSLTLQEHLNLCGINPDDYGDDGLGMDYDLLTTEYVQDDGEKAQAGNKTEKSEDFQTIKKYFSEHPENGEFYSNAENTADFWEGESSDGEEIIVNLSSWVWKEKNEDETSWRAFV